MHYFVFSNGYDRDYSITTVASCEYAVTLQEWEEFRKVYKCGDEALLAAVPQVRSNTGYVYPDATSSGWGLWKEFCENNTAEKAFMRRHCMVELGFEEFWRS